MTGNDRSTEAIRDEVTVVHSCPANDPRGLINQPAYDKTVGGVRHDHGRVQVNNLDTRAIGSSQDTLTICEPVRIIGQNAQRARRLGRACIQTKPQSVTREYGDGWIVGRIDHVHPHPQNFGIKRNVILQCGGWQPYFGLNFSHLNPPSSCQINSGGMGDAIHHGGRAPGNVNICRLARGSKYG